MTKLPCLLVLASAALFPVAAHALETTVDSQAGELRVTTVAGSLQSPWGMEFLPDGSILVTERVGTLRLVGADGRVGNAIEGVPDVDVTGQGGLLDVALDPDFSANRLVYLTYAEAGEGGNSTAAGRGRLSDDGRRLEGFARIFTQVPKYRGNKHFGSRIVFDGKGHLFIGVGERSDVPIRDGAQRLDNDLGKIVRLNLDGTIPADNPFVGRPDARPEVWSYGHRNIQGGARNPATGAIWFSEHGPKGGDEVNVVKPGLNYGWPIVSFGLNYDGTPVGSGKAAGAGFEPPIHHWTPVIGASGMDFYTGTLVPAWKGSVFFGGLASRKLVRVAFDGTTPTGEERLLGELGHRIRDVKQGPDGALYVLAEDVGEIIRVELDEP